MLQCTRLETVCRMDDAQQAPCHRRLGWARMLPASSHSTQEDRQDQCTSTGYKLQV
jgi:hypothetical protein